MLSFVNLKAGDLALRPGLKILKAADYLNYLESEKLIENAQINVDDIINQANNIFQQEKSRGYKTGKLQAQDEVAEILQHTIIECNHYYLKVEESIVALVMSCVEKIISEFDDKQLTISVIKKTLQSAVNEKRITLRVSHQQVNDVKVSIDNIVELHSEIDYIDVIPDDRLTNGGCIVETDVGIIDANIDTQLKVLEEQITKCYGTLKKE